MTGEAGKPVPYPPTDARPVPGAQRRSLTTTIHHDAAAEDRRARQVEGNDGEPRRAGFNHHATARRLRVVAGTAPAPRADHRQGHAIATEIAGKLSKVATGSRMQWWARQLGDLAAEIEAHAARDDVATLRRLAEHFGVVGPRLVRTA